MTHYYTTLNNKFIFIKIIDKYKKIVYNNIVINKKATGWGVSPEERNDMIMKKNEYVRFNVEGWDYFMFSGKKYKKTKTVYQKSKHEYILELIDGEYNVWYMIVLCGGFTKGPYKSRHHAIKILKDMPSYYNLHDLITKYYVECCPFERAYRDIVRILVRDYGCLDSYSLYLINEVFSDVYNDEMR